MYYGLEIVQQRSSTRVLGHDSDDREKNKIWLL